MRLQLQKYDFELRYKPGKELIIADTLSRAYISSTENEDWEKDIEFQVCQINYKINATPEKILQLITETNNDPELIELKKTILNGWPNNNKNVPEILKIYTRFKSELYIIDDLIFKGNCLVIP